MIKLLNANLYRLRKSKFFYFLIATFIVLFIFNTFKLYSSYSNIKGNDYTEKLVVSNIQYIGFFIALFITLFVGEDYAYGTIRNKIIVGNKRSSIYFSNLIITFVVCILLEFAYIIFSIIIGTHLFGKMSISTSDFR